MPKKTKSPKTKGEMTFSKVLDSLDDVPDNNRMTGPEIKYFTALLAKLICPDICDFRIPEEHHPSRYSHATMKTALSNMEELAKLGKKLNRDQHLELWDFMGDMAQDGECDSESESVEESESEEEEETTPKKRGRPKGSTKKKSA